MQYNITNDALHFTRGALSIRIQSTLRSLVSMQIWKNVAWLICNAYDIFGMRTSINQLIMIDLLLFCNGYLYGMANVSQFKLVSIG